LVSVSPFPTRTLFALADPEYGDGVAPEEFGGVAEAGADAAGAGAGAGTGVAAGAVRRAAGGAVVGAATAEAELGFSPGVYTGGSSSTVYSRIKRPRAQFTSTRNVTNGSGIASVECTSRASRPSLPLPTLKVRLDKNGGLSMP
jgi:hypothetical protein